MIDFRYHLVSLISVFLALAVGIALGAGPLKETLGDQLTGQVEQLREDRENLRAELEQAVAGLDRREAYIEGAAPALLGDLLTDWRVAVVLLDEPDSGVVDGVRARLEQSGAEVTATVEVLPQWSDPTQRSYRQALAASMIEYLEPAPEPGAGVEAELAEALVQALSRADGQDVDALAGSGEVLLDLLVQSELIATDEVAAPADAIVVVAGAPREETAADAAVLEGHLATLAPVVRAAADRTAGAAVVTDTAVAGSLVGLLRSEEDLSGVATVDGATLTPGQVSTPLALATAVAGDGGHFGFGDDADAVIPPRVEPGQPQRLVQPDPDGAEDATAGDDAAADDGMTDDATADDAMADDGTVDDAEETTAEAAAAELPGVRG